MIHLGTNPGKHCSRYLHYADSPNKRQSARSLKWRRFVAPGCSAGIEHFFQEA